jgi:hypothetical protein
VSTAVKLRTMFLDKPACKCLTFVILIRRVDASANGVICGNLRILLLLNLRTVSVRTKQHIVGTCAYVDAVLNAHQNIEHGTFYP